MAFLGQRLPSAGLAAYDGLQWRMTAACQMMRPSGHKGPASVVTAAALARGGSVLVGHSVAMGNAPDEVRTAATSQTASVEDDGFARMLSHLDLVPLGRSEPPA